MNTPPQPEATASQFATDRPAFEARLSAQLEAKSSARLAAVDKALAELVTIQLYVGNAMEAIKHGGNETAKVLIERIEAFAKKAGEALK